MNIIDIISKKRDKNILTEDEINYFVKGVTDESIEDYQISAMLMAMFINGLNGKETSDLTFAMAKSGDMLDLSQIKGIKVDKHSTGGVADTTTMILAPLVASCGVPVVKMSGRGLGFTGGTLDKLESIPNFNVTVSDTDVLKYGNTSQIVVMSQSKNLTPADKKLYALRDVTGTVNNISLIAASVMSKKIASGSDAMVLDVKCGTGAFMKDVNSATKLSEKMVEIGEHVGRKVIAIITNMSQPLGNNIGNSLEMIEAIEILKGKLQGDLLEVSLILGANMLLLANKAKDENEGKKLLLEKIQNGEGLKKFEEFIFQQGGNVNILNDYSLFQTCKYSHIVKASTKGFLSSTNCEGIGKTSVLLGAGRITKNDTINYGAGLIMKKRIGDIVDINDTICEMFTDNKNIINEAEKLFLNSITISNEKPEFEPLVYKKINS